MSSHEQGPTASTASTASASTSGAGLSTGVRLGLFAGAAAAAFAVAYAGGALLDPIVDEQPVPAEVDNEHQEVSHDEQHAG